MPEKKEDNINAGHRERLRSRFLIDGGKSMPDYELLELLLSIVIPRRDVKPLAKELIKIFGSYADVISAPVEELVKVNGVKENTATLLKVIKESSVRLAWQRLQNSDLPVIGCWDVLIDYCRSAMCYQNVEEFRIIFLDSRARVVGEEIQQRGTINQVAIHPREVINSAVKRGASSIILVHNHPTGIVTPSKADIDVTKKINEAAIGMEINLVDHIIVSKYDVYSFRDSGII